MIRVILGLLFFILFGVGLTLLFKNDTGYVLLRYQDTLLETSLVFFVIALVFGLWALLFVWRIFQALLGLPSVVPAAFRQRKINQSRDALVRGLRLYLEGQWREAESTLGNNTHDPNSRLINYLFAARAAQYQLQIERRDKHIESAHAAKPGSETAALLTQSRLQLMHKQDTQALACLERLWEGQPNHPVVLELLLQALQRLKDWSRLEELLADADRLEAGPAPWRRELAIQAYQAKLSVAAEDGLDALSDCWEKLPRKLRRSPKILELYVRLLGQFDAGHTEAIRMITQNLKRGWYPALAIQFGELQSEDSTSQLAAVEEWIKQHGEQNELLLLAGRLCLRNQLWGRARSHLETLMQKSPSPAVWHELGRLYEKTDDAANACRAYEQGLAMILEEKAES